MSANGLFRALVEIGKNKLTNKNNDNIKINEHKKVKVQGRRLCQFVVTIPAEFEWRGKKQAKLQLTINRTEQSIKWVARRLEVGRMRCLPYA